MAESDRQHASTMESLEKSDTASLDLSCESSIFDEEEEKKPYFINWSNYNDALLSFFKPESAQI
jgi:hypothetical protein